jgi:thymidylate synthase
MFPPRISRPSCAQAWLSASQAVYESHGHEANHVVIDVEFPTIETPQDAEVTRLLNSYLKQHLENGFTSDTVANTIFPLATYEAHGSPEFYDVYRKKVFPRLKRSGKDWGRYFERMIDYPKNGSAENLLKDLIAELKKNLAADRTFRNIYELPIFDPFQDREGSPIGRPCMSFLSFKLDANDRLLLCVMYRNHFYTEKLLGNLVGLGRLMHFIAMEANIEVGQLSVVSTHAQVDPAGGTQQQLKALHSQCVEVYQASSAVKVA